MIQDLERSRGSGYWLIQKAKQKKAVQPPCLMKKTLLALILVSVATIGRAAEGPFPDATEGHETLSATGKPEMVTESPTGQYSVVARCPSEFTGSAEYKVCEAGVHTVLRFRDKSKPDATLAVQIPDTFLGQSRYFFSPDDRWIIRSQHLGAGTNDLTLYSIASDGKVSRVALSKLVFDCAFAGLRCRRDKYRHLQIGFMSWDLGSGLVHLNADATPLNEHACPEIEQEVVYDLKKHKTRRAE
jgi:hypothetical protein